MAVPRDAESVRRALEETAAAAFQRAQAQMAHMNIQDARDVGHLLEHAATEAIARARGLDIPMPSLNRRYVGTVEDTFLGLWPILKRMFILYSIAASILVSSIIMYGLFYFQVQPGQAASEPLFFDYSGRAQHPSPLWNCTQHNNNQTCPLDAHRKSLNKNPWAAVDFFTKHTQWEAYLSEIIPKPLTETNILQPGKGYFFEVALELPDSELNRDSGMFMVHVHLQSSNGTMLASSLRPARLPHESQWIATVRKSIWLAPIILGAAHETRTVVVPSFGHFKESSVFPLRFATVSLIFQGSDTEGLNQAVEVMRGEILIGKELTDFQYLLREYFFTCYAVGVIILSAFEVLGLLVVRAYWKERRRQRLFQEMRGEQNDDPSDNLDLDESQLENETGSNNDWEDLPTNSTSRPPDPSTIHVTTDEQNSAQSISEGPNLETEAVSSNNDVLPSIIPPETGCD